ncbi:MAG: DUF11 domain-containing protein, partial [Planctomycetota bacterium]
MSMLILVVSAAMTGCKTTTQLADGSGPSITLPPPHVNERLASSPPTSAVEQVGFVDRLAAKKTRGPFADRTQTGDCMTCPPTTASPVVPWGRPIDPQEFLCNGGDQPPAAYLINDDSITALGAQDAVVHYTTESGEIEFQASNQVCLYSPRFGSVRQIHGAVSGEKAIGPRNTAQPVGPSGLNYNLPSMVATDVDELGRANVARRPDAVRDRNRGVPVNQVIEPVVAEKALQILATLDSRGLNRLDDSEKAILERATLAARSWMHRDAVEVMVESMLPPTLIRDQSVEAVVVYDFPDAGRLEIVKVADRDHAALGDEVQFAIHVRNVGDSVVREVQIADSLVTRLEYVEDSQRCDREALFETKGNEANSLKLLWTLAEPLEVGESATIEFR